MFRCTVLGLLTGALVALSPLVMAQDATKVLRIVPQADLKILDPVWTSANVTRSHGYMIYDTLFGLDEKGEAKPQMVDTYTVSPDARIWTFTLRDGLIFHDGQPVGAEDVIASLTRWAQRDAFGRQMFAAMEGADVLAPNQFRLRFKQPFGMVLDALAKPSTSAAFIMPKRIAVTSADKQIEDATGSGPFIFKQDEYRPGERVVYLKNPAYKPRAEPASGLAGGKRVYVDRVEWIVLKDVQTQVNALATGQVDIIEALPAEHFASLRADPNTKVVFPIPAGPAIILFNHLVPPFDNPKVRQAALLAINQEAMLRAQANDKALYQVCVSIYPCSSPLASTLSSGITGKPQFEKAKALLKEAGYDGTPVVLLHPADLAIIAKLPVVYAQLLRQAGFKVDMQTMDWATLQSRRAMKTTTGPGGWSAFISRVGAADALNPLFIPYLSGIGEKGFFGWPTNPKSEQMKIDYVAATTPEARLRIAHAMQQEVYDSAMFGPVGDLAFPSATRSNISGVLSASANVFWNIRKD